MYLINGVKFNHEIELKIDAADIKNIFEMYKRYDNFNLVEEQVNEFFKLELSKKQLENLDRNHAKILKDKFEKKIEKFNNPISLENALDLQPFKLMKSSRSVDNLYEQVQIYRDTLNQAQLLSNDVQESKKEIQEVQHNVISAINSFFKINFFNNFNSKIENEKMINKFMNFTSIYCSKNYAAFHALVKFVIYYEIQNLDEKYINTEFAHNFKKLYEWSIRDNKRIILNKALICCVLNAAKQFINSSQNESKLKLVSLVNEQFHPFIGIYNGELDKLSIDFSDNFKYEKIFKYNTKYIIDEINLLFIKYYNQKINSLNFLKSSINKISNTLLPNAKYSEVYKEQSFAENCLFFELSQINEGFIIRKEEGKAIYLEYDKKYERSSNQVNPMIVRYLTDKMVKNILRIANDLSYVMITTRVYENNKYELTDIRFPTELLLSYMIVFFEEYYQNKLNKVTSKIAINFKDRMRFKLGEGIILANEKIRIVTNLLNQLKKIDKTNINIEEFYQIVRKSVMETRKIVMRHKIFMMDWFSDSPFIDTLNLYYTLIANKRKALRGKATIVARLSILRNRIL